MSSGCCCAAPGSCCYLNLPRRMQRPAGSLVLPRRYIVVTDGGIRSFVVPPEVRTACHSFDSSVQPVFLKNGSSVYWFGVMDQDAIYSYEGRRKWPSRIQAVLANVQASSPLLQPLAMRSKDGSSQKVSTFTLCGWTVDFLLSTTDAAEFHLRRILARLPLSSRSLFLALERNPRSLRLSANVVTSSEMPRWPNESVRGVFASIAELWEEGAEQRRSALATTTSGYIVFPTPFAVMLQDMERHEGAWMYTSRSGGRHLFGKKGNAQQATPTLTYWHTISTIATAPLASAEVTVHWVVPGPNEVEDHRLAASLFNRANRSLYVCHPESTAELWSSLVGGLQLRLTAVRRRVEDRWMRVQRDKTSAVRVVSQQRRRFATDLETALFSSVRVACVAESFCTHVPFVPLSLFLAAIYMRQEDAPPEIWCGQNTIRHVREALLFGLDLWRNFCLDWERQDLYSLPVNVPDGSLEYLLPVEDEHVLDRVAMSVHQETQTECSSVRGSQTVSDKSVEAVPVSHRPMEAVPVVSTSIENVSVNGESTEDACAHGNGTKTLSAEARSESVDDEEMLDSEREPPMGWAATPMEWTKECAEIWSMLSAQPVWTDLLRMDYMKLLNDIHSTWDATETLQQIATATQVCWMAMWWHILRGPADLEYVGWTDYSVETAIEDPIILNRVKYPLLSVHFADKLGAVLHHLRASVDTVLHDASPVHAASLVALASAEFVYARCTLDRQAAQRSVRLWARVLGWEESFESTTVEPRAEDFVRRACRYPTATWALRSLVWASLPALVPHTPFTGRFVCGPVPDGEDGVFDLTHTRHLLLSMDCKIPDSVAAEVQHVSTIVTPEAWSEIETQRTYISLLRVPTVEVSVVAGAACFAQTLGVVEVEREIYCLLRRASVLPSQGRALVHWFAHSNFWEWGEEAIGSDDVSNDWILAFARAVRVIYGNDRGNIGIGTALDAAYACGALDRCTPTALRLEVLGFVHAMRSSPRLSTLARARAKQILSPLPGAPRLSPRARAWWTYAYAYTLIDDDNSAAEVLACVHTSLAFLHTDGSGCHDLRMALWKRAYVTCLALGDGGAAFYYDMCVQHPYTRPLLPRDWCLRPMSFTGSRLPGVPLEHFEAEKMVDVPTRPAVDKFISTLACFPLFLYHPMRAEWVPTGGVLTAVGTLRFSAPRADLGVDVPAWVAQQCRGVYLAPRPVARDVAWKVVVHLPLSRRTWILHPMSPIAREQWPEVEPIRIDEFTEALVHPKEMIGAHNRLYPLQTAEKAHIMISRILPVPSVPCDALRTNQEEQQVTQPWQGERLETYLLPKTAYPAPRYLYFPREERRRAVEEIFVSLFTSKGIAHTPTPSDGGPQTKSSKPTSMGRQRKRARPCAPDRKGSKAPRRRTRRNNEQGESTSFLERETSMAVVQGRVTSVQVQERSASAVEEPSTTTAEQETTMSIPEGESAAPAKERTSPSSQERAKSMAVEQGTSTTVQELGISAAVEERTSSSFQTRESSMTTEQGSCTSVQERERRAGVDVSALMCLAHQL